MLKLREYKIRVIIMIITVMILFLMKQDLSYAYLELRSMYPLISPEYIISSNHSSNCSSVTIISSFVDEDNDVDDINLLNDDNTIGDDDNDDILFDDIVEIFDIHRLL